MEEEACSGLQARAYKRMAKRNEQRSCNSSSNDDHDNDVDSTHLDYDESVEPSLSNDFGLSKMNLDAYQEALGLDKNLLSNIRKY
jgi:hypothetical protein